MRRNLQILSKLVILFQKNCHSLLKKTVHFSSENSNDIFFPKFNFLSKNSCFPLRNSIQNNSSRESFQFFSENAIYLHFSSRAKDQFYIYNDVGDLQRRRRFGSYLSKHSHLLQSFIFNGPTESARCCDVNHLKKRNCRFSLC